MQQALLKIVEGTQLQIHTRPERKPPGTGLPGSSSSPSAGSFNLPMGGVGSQPKGEVVTVDTSSILFIFTGAFIGLERIIADRIAQGSMGFNAHVRGRDATDLSQDRELLARHGFAGHHLGSSSSSSSGGGGAELHPLDLAEPGDLVNFGLIPELVGRIPVTTAVQALTEEMLVRVLLEPRNALLKQYEQLFQLSGVELQFTSPSLREIARAAAAMGTGARGLRTVVERLLSDAMFESPGMMSVDCQWVLVLMCVHACVRACVTGTAVKHVLVNEAVAKKKQAPVYFARGQRHRFEEMLAAEEERWVARGNKSFVHASPDLGSGGGGGGSGGGEEGHLQATGSGCA